MDNQQFQEIVLKQLTRLTEDVSGIKGDVSGLKTKVDGLETKVDGLETKVDGLETKVDGLETKVDGLETKVDGLETHQIKLENIMTEKIEVLFDGWKLHDEKLNRIEHKVDDLQMDVNSISIKTSSHDNKIIELSKIIKKA